MDKPLSVSYKTVATFFEATNGNYRNSIYVECSSCKYARDSCGDFLITTGHDCTPILLPVSDAQGFIGTSIDRSECVGILSNTAIIQLYQKWLQLHTVSDDTCPFHQMLHLLNYQ